MKKKMGVIALLALLLVGGTTNTYAADYKDKIFSFYVDTKAEITDSYTKYTDSSVYVHVTDGRTNYAKVQTWGYIDGKWVNKTIGTTASVPIGQYDSAKSRVRNLIVESNNNQATTMRLRFPINSEPTVVVGVWSPDCAGSYTYVN